MRPKLLGSPTEKCNGLSWEIDVMFMGVIKMALAYQHHLKIGIGHHKLAYKPHEYYRYII